MNGSFWGLCLQRPLIFIYPLIYSCFKFKLTLFLCFDNLMFHFLHFLLKYALHTIFHQLQAYNIVTQYVYNKQSDRHDKASTHLSPYKGIMILLTIFPMLSVTISMTYLFYKWKFVPLILLHLFHPFPQALFHLI